MRHAKLRITKKAIIFLLLLAFQWSACRQALAEAPAVNPKSQEMQELLLYYGTDEIVSTATKHPTPLSKAPAVATIITAEQIRNMGARTLAEAVSIAPGIGIYQDIAYDRQIEIRGVRTFHSNKVLVLLDGMRLNNLYTGGAFPFHSDLPLDNVKQIEIIRGPLSALYGSDAFVGAINMVTREGGEVNGVEAWGGDGSFDTQRLGFLAGKKYGDLQASAFLNYLESDGFRGRVEKDADPYPSSLSPGNTLAWRQRLDGGFSIMWRKWQLKYFHESKEAGPYIGAGHALNESSHLDFTDDNIDLSYRSALAENVTLNAKLYGNHRKGDINWELYSKGYGGGAFPHGVLWNPRLKNRTIGAELQVDYRPLKNNVLSGGFSIDRHRQYDVQNWANFNPLTGAPLAGGFQNITDRWNWNQNVHRNVRAWYLQDSWNITDKLNLIAGVRHDQYSDFGNTTNPRGGLVWEALKDTTLKVLVGKAFRAPSFVELYNTNNLSALGNADLKPERITTTEVSVETKALGSAILKVTYFKNNIDRLIRSITTGIIAQYVNADHQRTAGLEAEGKYRFNKTDNVYANITWLESKRLGSGGEITDIPKWRSNIGGNVAFAHYFNFNSNLFISGDRPRAAGDWRKDIPAYAVIDSTLTFKNFWKGLELQLVAKNLLDKRYDDPAPVTKVPGDCPREGREVFLEARYSF